MGQMGNTNKRVFPVLCALLILSIATVVRSQESGEFTITSQHGIELKISSQLQPLRINQIHNWELQLKNPDGSLLTAATLEVQGGMPAHDHGLPTQPQVTALDAPGSYLLEGIRFHMPGAWELEFTVITADGKDSARLEFNL